MSQISDNLYLGAAPVPHPNAVTSSDKLGPGVGPMGRIYYYDIVPLALAANNIALSQSPGAAGNLTLTAGAGVTSGTNAAGQTALTLDVPRAVRIVSGGDDSLVTFTVTGYDYQGQPMSEAITGANAGTATGKKAFSSIITVAISAASAGTVTVGTTDIFGLPYRVTDRVYVTSVNWNNTLARDTGTMVVADTTSPATTTTGDVRGTYLPSSGASDGAKRLVMGICLPSIASGPDATRAGALGVNQNLQT